LSTLLESYARSRVPLYIQVASVLRQRLESGHWIVGERIPTLENFESEFQVALVTVRKAVDLLREEGLLQSWQGRGTFVVKQPLDRHWLKLPVNWADLVDSLKANVPSNIRIEDNVPAPTLGPHEGERAESYVGLKNIQSRNNEPYLITDLCLARQIYERDPQRFLTEAALPAIDGLEDVTFRNARQTAIIGSASPEIADLMKIPLGAPTIESRLTIIDNSGEAICVGNMIYRADCIRLQFDFFRGSERLNASNRRGPL